MQFPKTKATLKQIKDQLLAEDYFVFVFAFWVTIAAVRLGIYRTFQLYDVLPGFFFHGVHIHHFVLGLLCMLGALIIFSKRKTGSLTGLIFLGIGTGLFADEAWLVLTRRFLPETYWGLDTLILMILFGIVPYAFITHQTKTRLQQMLARPPLAHRNAQNPFLSVVIPAFNEEKFLDQSLKSLADQSYNNFELIVVDNNSTDRTAAVAREYGATVIAEKNVGVGFARETGFRAAKGEIIATTDADTVVPRDWLQRIINEFQNHPSLVAFGGLYRLYSGPLLARFAIRYLAPLAWRIDRHFMHGWSLPGANMAVRKSAFEKIGGFKTSLQLAEDADLSQRLKALGEVRFDQDFQVLTSGRRFRHGLLYALGTYAPNSLVRMFWKKEKFVRLPAVRKEASFLSLTSTVPLLLIIIFLFSLFSWMNPTISQAKEVQMMHRTWLLAAEKTHAAYHRASSLVKPQHWMEKIYLHGFPNSTQRGLSHF